MTDSVWAPDGSNLVVHADNADYLPTLPDGAFTLIYVDPPFNTGRVQKRQETRMVLNAGGEGDRVGFKGRSYDTIKGALHKYDDAFSDYWSFLEPRLVEAWRLLADDGTLYLHLDYREVHYAKVMLDAIFGRECFLNEIHLGLRLRRARQVPLAHQARQHPRVRQEPARYHFDSAEVDREPYMAPGLVTPAKRELGKLPTDVWWHTSSPPRARRRRLSHAEARRADPACGGCLQPPRRLVPGLLCGLGDARRGRREAGRRFVCVDQNQPAIDVMGKTTRGPRRVQRLPAQLARNGCRLERSKRQLLPVIWSGRISAPQAFRIPVPRSGKDLRRGQVLAQQVRFPGAVIVREPVTSSPCRSASLRRNSRPSSGLSRW